MDDASDTERIYVRNEGSRKKGRERGDEFSRPEEGRVRLKTVAISSRWRTQREQVFEGFCHVVLHDTTFL